MSNTAKSNAITLHNVSGIARYAGVDQDGAQWLQQFYSEMEDAAIESYYNTYPRRDLSKLTNEQMRRRIAPYFDRCCVCGRRIAGDAYFCLDGDDMACEEHVILLSYDSDDDTDDIADTWQYISDCEE